MRAIVKRVLPVFLPSLAISVWSSAALAQPANQQSAHQQPAPVAAPSAQIQNSVTATDKTSQEAPEKTIAQLETELPILVKQYGEDSERVGDILFDLGGKLSAAGRANEARDIYVRCIANYTKRLGADAALTQAPKFNLADVYDDLDQYDEARKLYTEVVETWMKTLGGKHKLTLRAIQKLGETFIRTDRFEQAQQMFEFALPRRIELHGAESSQALTTMSGLARAYLLRGKYAEGNKVLQQIQEIYAGRKKDDDDDSLDALALLANSYEELGNYSAALSLKERVLAGFSKLYGQNDNRTLQARFQKANGLMRMAQYGEALVIHQAVLAQRIRSLGTDHPSAMNSRNSIADVLKNLGRVKEAAALELDIAQATEKRRGKDELSTHFAWDSYASSLGLMGRYVEAGEIKERTTKAVFAKLGGDNPLALNMIQSFATALTDVGQNKRASELQEQVLKGRQKVLGAEHRDTLAITNNLSINYIRSGQPAKARDLLKGSIAIIEAAGASHASYVDLPYFYRTLGEAHSALGDKNEARETYRRSLELVNRVLGPDHLLAGFVCVYLAQVETEPARRIQLNMQGLRVGESSGTPDMVWRAADGLRSAYEDMKSPTVAILYGKQAVNTLQSLRAGLSSLGSAMQGTYLNDKRKVYTELADLLIGEGRLSEAQQVMRMLKEDEYNDFVTRSEKTDARETKLTMNSQEAAWLDRFQQISSTLVQISKRKSELDGKAKMGLSEEEKVELAKVEADLKVSRQAFDSATKQMLEDSKKAAAGGNERLGSEVITSVRAMRGDLRQLGHGAVLLHFVMAEDKLWIMLTTPEIQIARQAAISSVDLNRKINELRMGLRNPQQDIKPLAQELYKLLLGPIEGDLKQAQAKTLMLSLDGAIRYVPFAALHDGKQWAIENYRFAIYTEAAKSKLKDAPQALWSLSGLGLSKAVSGFDALPSVKDELASLNKKTGGVMEGDTYIDDAFTMARVKTALADQRPVLHIASHFKFTPGTESDSYLLLGDGGRLSLRQIREDDLQFDHVDLLTLSACETAVGDNAKGAEVEGLGAIAQKQGAKAVLATLWPVADKSTGIFMREMYRIRAEQKLTKSEAIRQVQMGFVNGKYGKFAGAAPGGERGARAPGAASVIAVNYDHPYFWAPFILMGNWL